MLTAAEGSDTTSLTSRLIPAVQRTMTKHCSTAAQAPDEELVREGRNGMHYACSNTLRTEFLGTVAAVDSVVRVYRFGLAWACGGSLPIMHLIELSATFQARRCCVYLGFSRLWKWKVVVEGQCPAMD